ncbi:glycosyltransferase [Synechococcus sp. KORDI-100]|uniref:glycosyltransferase n=1 Tax=Synechococcus sp. KORDI-100 TaxID=1280380 RepID=UPI00138E4EDB|nr:glycosyltransferase [Synechococcus sp. KORDI-100]
MFYYIHHTALFEYNTGIQRCVRSIARALISAGIPLRPVMWSRQDQGFAAAPDSFLPHLARWNGPATAEWSLHGDPDHWTDRWLLIVELIAGNFQPQPQELRASADRLGLKVAWVFHDAIPHRWMHLYGAEGDAVARSHRRYMCGLQLFERVFANSRTTAGHLKDFLLAQGQSSHSLDALIRPLPLAIEFQGSQRTALTSVRQRNSDRLRLLCVSSLEPRKNHRSLIKAIAWLTAHELFHAELILVGWDNHPNVLSEVQRAIDLRLPITWKQHVDDEELQWLYEWSHCTVYPSLEEGFGLPVAESLWHRRPCLTSAKGALGELSSGGGCLRVDTSKWSCLASGILRFIRDPQLMKTLNQEIENRPMRNWSDYVDDLLSDISIH